MIDQDHQRFRQIVKGRIRGDLRKFITRGEFIGKEGKHLISIPVHGIEIPTFRYGDNNGGVGAGEGEEGQTVGGQDGSGKGQGGEQPGQHMLEVDVSLEELADILGEELHLPRIEPKGRKQITTIRDRLEQLHDDANRQAASLNVHLGVPQNPNDPSTLGYADETRPDDPIARAFGYEQADPARPGQPAKAPAAEQGEASDLAFWAGGFVNFGTTDKNRIDLDRDAL